MNAKSRAATTVLAMGLAAFAFAATEPVLAARHGESSWGRGQGSERRRERSDSSRRSNQSYDRPERQRQRTPAPTPVAAPAAPPAAPAPPRHDRGSRSRPVDVSRPAPRPAPPSAGTPPAPTVTNTPPPGRDRDRDRPQAGRRERDRDRDRPHGTWGPGRPSTGTQPAPSVTNTPPPGRDRDRDRDRPQAGRRERDRDRPHGTWGPGRPSTGTPPAPSVTNTPPPGRDRDRDRPHGTWGPGRPSTDTHSRDRFSRPTHRWTRPPVRFSTTKRPRPIYRVGYRRPRLPLNSFRIVFSSRHYHYCDGYFYLPSTYGYEVCHPPYGIIVPILPWWYGTILVGNLTYYVCDDVWYLPSTGGYRVVERPRTVVVETTVVENPAATVTTVRNSLDDSPDGTRHTIWLDGADGTRTPVDLLRIHGRWRGPKDEYYDVLPTVDQLAPLYAPAPPAVEDVAAEPTYRDDTKRIVWLENFNGSATRVVLHRSLSGKWVGEKGEFYAEFPTNEQLRKVYGLDVDDSRP